MRFPMPEMEQAAPKRKAQRDAGLDCWWISACRMRLAARLVRPQWPVGHDQRVNLSGELRWHWPAAALGRAGCCRPSRFHSTDFAGATFAPRRPADQRQSPRRQVAAEGYAGDTTSPGGIAESIAATTPDRSALNRRAAPAARPNRALRRLAIHSAARAARVCPAWYCRKFLCEIQFEARSRAARRRCSRLAMLVAASCLEVELGLGSREERHLVGRRREQHLALLKRRPALHCRVSPLFGRPSCASPLRSTRRLPSRGDLRHSTRARSRSPRTTAAQRATQSERSANESWHRKSEVVE